MKHEAEEYSRPAMGYCQLHKAEYAIKKTKCAWCLSTGHVHAVVAATVGVVGKELIGCKFNVSGCCGAVRHRITPAIDDVLRSAASGEKARAGFMSRSSMVCIARSRAMKPASVLKSLERLPKGPVTKAMYSPFKLRNIGLHKHDHLNASTRSERMLSETAW
jgi:hypothetical protein